ncbi:MAG: iron ABC transporter substrate-binding protein [Candidatus Nanopelagicales bacterium]|nr:iron ABC transporter substrate-binding protein [Candidatus Nanopelagicales bacterium]MDZ4249816.1 iron ABC transporter substrate-binding protein [Candidatus Nanopelagicales bacterium]
MSSPSHPLLARTAVVFAAAALALTACSTGSDPTESPASGGLTVYSGRSEALVGPLLSRFTEETGIALSIRYGDTAELASQIIEEGDKAPAAVFFAQDAGALGAVSAAGLLAKLPAKSAKIVPPTYRSTDGTWTGVTGRARVIAYDPRQVPKAQVPQSVFDLTDAKWKGQVAVAPNNGSFQAFVTAMRVTVGDARTEAWLSGLVSNDVQKYENNVLILNAVDTGQVKLGLINHYYWYEKAAEIGADAINVKLAFTAPKDPGSLVNVAGVAILKNAAQNADAQRLVEWMLSAPTQEWFVENTHEYPLLPKVAADEGLPPLTSLRGPNVPLAELTDLPGTLAMLERTGLL